jgi:hypothetical protein
MPTGGWIDPSSAITLTNQIGSQPNWVTMGSTSQSRMKIGGAEAAEHADDDGGSRDRPNRTNR